MDHGLHCLHNQISMPSNFEFYLKSLAAWLDDNKYFGFSQTSIILDNCPSHRAKIVMDYLKSRSWSIYFLPPYSPQLAPVELAFNHIKSHIRYKVRGTIVKLNKAEALNISSMIMKPVSAKSVRGYYDNFFKTIISLLPIFKNYETI